MKRTSSKTNSTHQKADSLHFEKEPHPSKHLHMKSLNISPLSLNTLATNTTNCIDSGPDTLSHKQSKGHSSSSNYEGQYYKLSNVVREIFAEIKDRMINEDPQSALILKKSVPLDQDNDMLLNQDPTLILQYIKKIYEKILEFKNDAENELSAKKENECSDYESMLQKLEAEVRQHIRIEQQLKLFAESTQTKLDEMEKSYDPEKMNHMKKEIENLKNENHLLHEKLKKRDVEIENNRKELSSKSGLIKEYEHQVENIPVLKSKIRELERLLTHSSSKPPSSNVLKGSNKNTENVDKNLSFSNQFNAGDVKARKGSQPSISFQSYELAKQKHHHEKDKENLETYKLDLSKHIYENSKGYRSSSHTEAGKENTRSDKNIAKPAAKKEESTEDFSAVLERMKKTFKNSHSRNMSKENLRSSEQTITPEEHTGNHTVNYGSKPSKRDSIESSKYIYDKRAKSGTYFQDMTNKSWSRIEYRPESRADNSRTSFYKDYSEADHPVASQKNNIPKPRPSAGGHEHNTYAEYNKHRKETEIYDLNKLKVSSPKKMSQDRSQSVDGKQKLQKKLKSKDDLQNKYAEHETSHQPTKSSYNTYLGDYNNHSRNLESFLKNGHNN